METSLWNAALPGIRAAEKYPCTSRSELQWRAAVVMAKRRAVAMPGEEVVARSSLSGGLALGCLLWGVWRACGSDFLGGGRTRFLAIPGGPVGNRLSTAAMPLRLQGLSG